MTRRSQLVIGAVGGLLVICAGILGGRADAFCTLESRWQNGQIFMSFNFPPSGVLINGTTSWAENVESAMQEWSAVTDDFRFISNGPGSGGQNNFDDLNNMIFATESQGSAFEDDVLALTLTRTDLSGNAIESDIVFNADVIWNAYDGPIRIDATGGVVFDFRRVALHELGHALGLDHPDEACGQTVDAVMNAQTSDADRLTNDDRNGLSNIYSADNTPPSADAGRDQFGDGTQPFILNGGGSTDFDGVIESYDWRIDGELIARGRVVEIMLRRGSYVVELTVTDDRGSTDVDTLVITVGSEFAPPEPNNERPIANAGPDVNVRPGQTVTLDGSQSFDPDGIIDRYVWSRSGVVLGRDPVIQVALSGGVHLITLTVFDDRDDAASDSVLVTVSSEVTEGPDPDPTITDPAADAPPAPTGLCGIFSLLTALPTTLALTSLKKYRRPKHQ